MNVPFFSEAWVVKVGKSATFVTDRLEASKANYPFLETAVPPKNIYIGNAIKKTIVSGKVKDCIDSLRSIVFLLFEVHSNCERQSDFPDCHTAFMGLRDLAFPSVPKILQK